MNTLAIALAAGLSLSTQAAAQPASEDAFTDGVHFYCGEVSEIAATIMESRQREAPMSALMDAIRNEIVAVQPLEILMKEISLLLVLEAYAQPRWQSEERQTESVAAFANAAYRDCYVTLSEMP